MSENEIGSIVVDTAVYYYKKFTTNLTNQHELLPSILSMFVMVCGGSW